MLRSTKIANELAVIERKLQETSNQTLKDALKKKQARLKDELNDAKKSTPQLAKKLLAEKQKVKSLSKIDFNDLVRRLSKKPEYSFLKTMNKSTVRTDLERKAKPVGWRFKGRGNYDKPTQLEIKKGKKSGAVYREARPIRSDVSHVVRLGQGGNASQVKNGYYYLSAKEKKNLTNFFIEFGIPKNEIKIPDNIPADRFYGFLFRVNLSNYKMFEIGFSSLSIIIHASAGNNGSKPELFIEISAKSKGRKKEYINDSYYIELSDDFSSVKKMEYGGSIEIGDRVKASKEYGGKSGTVIDKRGSFVVVEYSNGDSDSYHESDLVKKMEHGGEVDKTTYTVAGRPVTLNKGQKENGTDWTVTFLSDSSIGRKGEEIPLSDVLALIKPFPKGIKMEKGGGVELTKEDYKEMISQYENELKKRTEQYIKYSESGNIEKANKAKSLGDVASKNANIARQKLNELVNKMKHGGSILTEEQEEAFNEWKNDGNVAEAGKDVYTTQDSQWSNRIKGIENLKKYYYNEFLKN